MGNNSKIFFLFMCFLIYPIGAPPQARDLKFQHISTEDGLPNNRVNTIFQDHLGFLWLGTNYGLVRYDGYQMLVFNTDEDNPYSISGNQIISIHEDKSGNLWLGTDYSGVNKFERSSNRFFHFKHNPNDRACLSDNDIFNCYMDQNDNLWVIYSIQYLDKIDTRTSKVTRYRYDPDDSCSISSNRIAKSTSQNLRCLSFNEDHTGTIWIGTQDAGLNMYNREMDNFIRYQHRDGDPHSLSHNFVSGIFEDKQHNFWIGTWGGGVNLFSRETGIFTHFRHQAGNDATLACDYCFSIDQDRTGSLWFTLDYALDRFDPQKSQFIHYRNERICPDDYYLNRIWLLLYEDEKGDLWFISSGGKLMIINPALNTWQIVHPNPENAHGLQPAPLISFYKDSSHNLWFGTSFRGIHKCDPYAQYFTHERSNEGPFSLSSNYVNVLHQSRYKPNHIWIGTDEGLDLYRHDTGQFIPEHIIQQTLKGKKILALLEDSGILWVGTSLDGLYRYDLEIKQFSHYSFRSDLGLSSDYFSVWSIFKDSTGEIWILNLHKPRGLYRFNQEGTFTRFVHDIRDTMFTSTNTPWCFHAENDSSFWVGMSNGLYLYHMNSKRFTHNLEGTSILKIYKDSRYNFWLGTQYHGLGLFNPQTGNAVFFDMSFGFPSNNINAIVEDKNGYLWLGTENGLVKFESKTKSFITFHREHGLISEIFQPAEMAVGPNEIWMTTANGGIVVFDPEQMRYNPTQPKVVFTDFKISNKSISPSKNSPLQNDITISKKIHLAHWQNDISIECAALHFTHPEKNQYAFKLENFDEEWNYTGTNRIAVYTNLDPGSYILRAKGASSDRVWNEKGTSLRIIIHPPWWATLPAYAFYIIVTAVVVIVTWRLQLRRIRLRHHLKMKEFESAQLKKVDGLKSQFFANISHEFRTPLTLILGPLEKLYAKTTSQKLRTECAIMLRNGRRLLRLINQLLDFSKLEAGRMRLDKATLDIAYLCRSIIGSFASVAEQKNISLTLKTEKETMLIEADRDKVEKIIVNLLSNALKFTSEGGTVQAALGFITINQTGFVKIEIRDSGIGIPPEKLSHIFDRFYQVDESHTRAHEGAGIGLALTKELVELHGGQISVASEHGVGSTFTVMLPVGTVDEHAVGLHKEWHEESVLLEDTKEQEATLTPDKSKPLVLIVDDNPDVRCYIRDILKKHYKTSEARDGLDGYEKATDMLPDLIISDVMMPSLDGFELCRQLKTDERTSHIPVILLTAKAGEENRLSGLETGADAYVVKPFQARELIIRVQNLVESRRQLRERFSREITLQPKDITITSTDEKFLQRAMSIIEEHLGDSNFDVQTFAKKVGLSHAHLHRKLRALVNMSPSQFIRSMRLKRALMLLEQHHGTVAEIAYQVGFNNPAYFAECFRKQFGRRPSEYIKSTRKKTMNPHK